MASWCGTKVWPLCWATYSTSLVNITNQNYSREEIISDFPVDNQAMYCNDSISNKVRIIVARLRQKARRVRPFREVTEIVPLLQEKRMGNGIGGANGQANYNGVENNNSNGQTFNSGQGQHHIGLETIVEDGVHSSCRIGDLDDDQFLADSPWRRSTASSWWGFVLRWPITTALWATIPDCRRRPQLRILTFMMCIVWIGMTSYLVAYLITIVGKIAMVCGGCNVSIMASVYDRDKIAAPSVRELRFFCLFCVWFCAKFLDLGS